MQRMDMAWFVYAQIFHEKKKEECSVCVKLFAVVMSYENKPCSCPPSLDPTLRIRGITLMHLMTYF